jgi:hypothetical protein
MALHPRGHYYVALHPRRHDNVALHPRRHGYVSLHPRRHDSYPFKEARISNAIKREIRGGALFRTVQIYRTETEERMSRR